MFIYSLKASTVKFFTVLTLSVIALVTLIVFIPKSDEAVSQSVYTDGQSVSFDKIKTNEDRISFLSQFGWEVEAEPAEEAQITVPAEFDKVFIAYNELQKQQGLDLGKYKKKKMVRYTYVVTNYPDYDGKVYANIIVYRNRVVGGDICSADTNGFLHGFALEKRS